MLNVTSAFIAAACPDEGYEDSEVELLNAALEAFAASELDAFLLTLSFPRSWDLYDLAGDLDKTFAFNPSAYDHDLVTAVNWIALSAKAYGQGHIKA